MCTYQVNTIHWLSLEGNDLIVKKEYVGQQNRQTPLDSGEESNSDHNNDLLPVNFRIILRFRVDTCK